jgi:hypothetical protein
MQLGEMADWNCWMTWTKQFMAYGMNPHETLPPQQAIQASKMDTRVQSLTRDLGMPRRDALRTIVESAKVRARAAPPTLFLVNGGSSGSHWIEGMLAELPGLRACGEVYFPSPLCVQIRAMETRERVAFIDAVHQVHARGARPVHKADIMINSAHSWSPAALIGRPSRCVFLVRDPLETVLSRTFRKPGWKDKVAPESTDTEYLQTNLAYVKRFFERSAAHTPAAVIRYEDAHANPAPVLRTILDVLEFDASDRQLSDISHKHSADSQIAKGRRLSNLYTGSRDDYDPALVDYAASALRDLRERYGYGNWHSVDLPKTAKY